MATATATTVAPFGAVATLRLVDGFTQTVHKVKEWNDARITRRALLKLTDRQLEDIGLARVQLF